MRRLLVVALAVVAALAPSVAVAGCQTRSCEIRVARKQCERGQVRACILRAALHRGQSVVKMTRMAWCESTMNPRAISPGGHLGLFQFHPGTWAGLKLYARRDPLSAKWSSLAAAWMLAAGRGNEWACQ